ncbi:hypothetical protein BGZ65_011433, partial [Modicella reniformis]
MSASTSASASTSSPQSLRTKAAAEREAKLTEFSQFSPLDFMTWMSDNFPERYPTPSKQKLHAEYTRLSKTLAESGGFGGVGAKMFVKFQQSKQELDSYWNELEELE